MEISEVIAVDCFNDTTFVTSHINGEVNFWQIEENEIQLKANYKLD